MLVYLSGCSWTGRRGAWWQVIECQRNAGLPVGLQADRCRGCMVEWAGGRRRRGGPSNQPPAAAAGYRQLAGLPIRRPAVTFSSYFPSDIGDLARKRPKSWKVPTKTKGPGTKKAKIMEGPPLGNRGPGTKKAEIMEGPPRKQGTWHEKGRNHGRSPSENGDLARKRPKSWKVPTKTKGPGTKKAEIVPGPSSPNRRHTVFLYFCS